MKKTMDVFIMAGGLNSRFGSPKYLEKIGDETVLEKLLEMVRSTHINNIFLNPIIIFNHESTIPDNLRATIFRASKSAKGTATMIKQYLKEFGEDNIREVIAFPKNGRAVDPMSAAPSTVAPLQLFELGIDVTVVNED